MKIKGVILALSLVTLSFLLHAQKRAVLDWQFFKNDRPANGQWQAFTYYNLLYNYKLLGFEEGKAKLSFVITNQMDTSRSYFEASRRLKNDLYLLKHEQGHADIVYIYAIKLRDEYAQTTFSKANYRSEIIKIFKIIFAAMRAEQARYDDEVAHGKNVEEQQRWNKYFQQTVSEIDQASKS